MNFFEVLEKRVSVREFKPTKMEEQELQKILRATASAPSAGNLQAFRGVVVVADDIKQKLAKAAYGQGFIAQCSTAIVFFAIPSISAEKYGTRGSGLYALQDATIAASYAQLASTALGYGTVWVGAFNDEQVRTILNAPEEAIPVAIICIGTPMQTPRRTMKLHPNELFSYDTFKS
jgi:nitroreductase